jgi:hypothetical protein
MATDFRADRARVFKIIGSGSSGSAGPGLAIYSASSANDDYSPGEKDLEMFSQVGEDVFLFVSGTKSTATTKRGSAGASVSLFGGDLVVSGTLWAEKMVVEVDEITTGSITISGSLVVSQSAEILQGLTVNRTRGIASVDDFLVKGQGDGGSNGKELILASAGRASGRPGQVFILSGTTDGSGKTDPYEYDYTDLAFFVSGTIGSKDVVDSYGVSLFGGDAHVSGNLSVDGLFNKLLLYKENATDPFGLPTSTGNMPRSLVAGTTQGLVNTPQLEADILI